MRHRRGPAPEHGIVDKPIGDEVMGLYFPPLTRNGRYVDAMVRDARELLTAVTAALPRLDVGIGLAVGPAFVGMVGDGDVRDFTALGDVVNVAAGLQTRASAGQIVMTREVADLAALAGTEHASLQLKGRSKPIDARVLTITT